MIQVPLILAILLVLVSAFVPDGAGPRTPLSQAAKAAKVPLGLLGLVLVAVSAAMNAAGWGAIVSPAVTGLGIGAVLVLLAAVTGANGLAVGAAGALAVLAFVDENHQAVGLFGLAASASVAALAFRSPTANLAAIGAAGLAAATYLGEKHFDAVGTNTVAPLIALVGATGALAVQPLKAAILRPLAGGAAALVAAGVLGMRVVSDPGVVLSVLTGVTAGFVVHLLLPAEGEADSLRIGIAGLVWLGVATVAFFLLRGFGMSLALVGGLAVLLSARNAAGLLSLGTLAGLVLYRLLREAYPDTSRALDVGQHYALIGLALGLILPLLPSETSKGARQPIANLLWGGLTLALPVLVLLLFGGVAAVGFIAGTGFGSLSALTRKRNDALPLAVGMGMAGTTVLLSGQIATIEGLTRDEKLRVLAYAAVGLAMVGGALWALEREPREVAA
jgi:hypothetical protein